MNRAQKTLCRVTNEALTGALLFVFVIAPGLSAEPHHADVELVSHR